MIIYSRNGYRVQFSPLRRRNLTPWADGWTTLIATITPQHQLHKLHQLPRTVSKELKILHQFAEASTLPTSGGLLIGADQAIAREAVQPALNALNAIVAAPNNEN
uniref:Transcriptional regulator n=1 Tax=Globodera pallida TaxID=36090 RepID=A0A183BUX3_GLOPA